MKIQILPSPTCSLPPFHFCLIYLIFKLTSEARINLAKYGEKKILWEKNLQYDLWAKKKMNNLPLILLIK